MTEHVALEFTAPTGEQIDFEWSAAALASLDPTGDAGSQPAWRLGGELDWDELELVRVLSARLGDGRLLALAALRPAGGVGHGDELVAAAIGSEGEFEQLPGPLLSTEYDPDGMPRRIGLEIGTDDGPVLRLAGDVTANAQAVEGGLLRRSAALDLRGAGDDPGAAVLDLLTRR